MEIIGVEEQIQCVEREIKLRNRVYPYWVSKEKMTQKKADYEITAMQAVLRTLKGLPKQCEQMKLLEQPANGQWR